MWLSRNKLETQPVIAERVSSTLPATAQSALFTVRGRIILTHIIGEVTVVIQNQACNIDLYSNPSVGADVALCAVVGIANDAVGTMYNITGTLANAMVATTSGAMIAQASSVIISDGTIDLKTSATNTGEVKWTIHYIPLDRGSSVVAV